MLCLSFKVFILDMFLGKWSDFNFKKRIIELFFSRGFFSGMSSILLAFYVFLFPFDLSFVWNSDLAYFNGNFNSYAVMFLSLVDFLPWFAGLCFLLALFREETQLRHNTFFLIFLVLVLFIVLHSFVFGSFAYFSWFLIWKFLSVLLVVFLISQGVFSLNFFIGLLLSSVVLQAAFGVLQFVFQSDLGLQVLGESVLNIGGVGVAKLDFQGEKILRAYGFFSHPNILGGVLLLAFGLCTKLYSRNKLICFAVMILILLALILTFSRSAWLGLLIFAIFSFALREKKLVFSSLMFLLGLSLFVFLALVFDLSELIYVRLLDFGGEALSHRAELMGAAWQMFLDQPLGIGLGAFTLVLPNFFPDIFLYPWELQPVHNIYLLALVELGFLGFLLLSWLFGSLLKKAYFRGDYILVALCFAFLTIGFFDHYLYTSTVGWFVVAVLILLALEDSDFADLSDESIDE
jgi:hypothetical protein